MKLVIDNIALEPFHKNPDFQLILNNHFPGVALSFIQILRRSLDARKKNAIVYRHRVLVETDDETARLLLNEPGVSMFEEKPKPAIIQKRLPSRPLIVGAGPAGLFAALYFVESGVGCDIIERGKPVEERMLDIRSLEKDGTLNLESNVVFGEGGAGTYSDGKLTTRTHREEAEWFFKKLVEFGAPDEIMYEAKPHIGTDRLLRILKAIRSYLESKGTVFSFQSRMEDIETKNEKIIGIRTSRGEFLEKDIVVLATGHSARDVYALLQRKGIALAKKGFAVGVRVEHPRQLIDEIQFGKDGLKAGLSAAEYFLVWNNAKTGKGIYSFCMCPGGSVINASSEHMRLCTNGMSNSRRDSNYSNAAIVVSLRPDDFADDVLAGIAFQRMLEEQAYALGGGGFVAPAQRIPSFIKGKYDATLPELSYRPGCVAARVDTILPDMLRREIIAAFRIFDAKMPGFSGNEGVIIGIETRTSSPVRIVRGKNFQSEIISGLYPAGEGAGYAGGIVSSAVDGIRTAKAILEQWGMR